MILDLLNSHLYTDSGNFIKALHCPKKVSWGSLVTDQNSASVCKECSRIIHDTSKLSDEDVCDIVRENPSACFALSPTQSNVSVSLHPMQNKSVNRNQI